MSDSALEKKHREGWSTGRFTIINVSEGKCH